MRKLSLALVATASAATLSLTALQAQEAPPVPGQMDVSEVAAGTYKADPAHTIIGFRLNHFGFNDYFGVFGASEGTLMLDPTNPSSAKVDVTIPITSVAVAADELKDHLLRAGKDGAEPDFFGPNPTAARFTSTNVEVTGPTTAMITGNLTMNGMTHPVLIAAEFTGVGTNPMNKAETIGFEGRAQINRSDYGLDFALPFVSDQVILDISAAFEKQ
ncbi:YceI family protein [Altericroceibacterium endophyticum]|uniref:Lipid/polyisoprenoid-binding YceI-like domain-containing protein n=1 Tax=Altericroceibacterium endophyticum TaxID=1808508 RepID=A0A6I4T4P5_9SPHN|nr:YceI family protein [Altericroceibacterium endophyticum]MXO64625.1 hypothetical protein [Altericroceibacterium endophyticum]